jgi:hypothetical protein
MVACAEVGAREPRRLVVKDAATGLHDVGPTTQGAGRENLSVAADATTWMDPVSASFGRSYHGHPTSVTITLSNLTGSDETFSISVTKLRRIPRWNGPEYLEC